MVFLFIFLIILIMIITLKIKIEIHNIDFTVKEPVNNSKVFNIKDDYVIKITFKVIGIIPVFKINITKEKVDKISKKIKKIDIKSHIKSFKDKSSLLDTRKIISSINLKIKEFNLKADIGLDSIMLLTLIIPAISTLVSIVLAKKNVKIKKQFYQIKPLYNVR